MLTEELNPTGLPQLLLAEDSETSAALILRYLSDQYQVLHARDGQHAWELLAVQPGVELILTDIQMPRMSGQELLTKIRASDMTVISNLPVIVMTSADDNADRHLAFENGANDFVNKPVDPVELKARLNVHRKLARTIRELEESRKLLQEQATTDVLTQMKNRRAFGEISLHHFMLALRHNADMSLLTLDIDHFKKINDTYGHPGGDEALVQVSKIIKSMVRASDVPARMGGEEFTVLLPNTNRVGAGVLAERIRVAIESHKFAITGVSVSITVSVGVSSFGNDGNDSLDQLLEIADRRLYIAKENGRNRVILRG